MSKVLCKLPNASTKINGFAFVTHKHGMISEELDDEVALEFAAIPGYEIWDPGKTDPAAAAILEAARKAANAQTGGATGAAPISPPSPNSPPPAAAGASQNPTSTPPQGGKPPGTPEPTF
jgi:hypothetical protein